MNRAYKPVLFLSLALLLFAFTPPTMTVEYIIRPSGNPKLALQAINEAVIKTGARLSNVPDVPGRQYAHSHTTIDSSVRSNGDIRIEAQTWVMGCAHTRTREKMDELLQEVVAQASRDSGQDMQIMQGQYLDSYTKTPLAEQ